MRRAFLFALAALAATFAASAVAADTIQLTPVGRLAFPDKGYVLDLPSNIPVAKLKVTARENGALVRDSRVTPLAASGLRAASILAFDASDSMRGAPYRAAIDAARKFVDAQSVKQEVGLVAFNSRAIVIQPPTKARVRLHAALAHPPALAYGTTIYDTIQKSLEVLAKANVSTSSIVLLSDGTDIGSTSTLDSAVQRARARHVRVFTVGLHSAAFDRAPLEEIAQQTGGTYTEASSVSELAPIFAGLSGKFTNEFVLRYRSREPVGARVHLAITAGGQSATADYVARSSAPKPFHRSLLSRFFLSSGSLILFALLDAVLIAFAVRAILRYRPKRSIVHRVSQFVGINARPPAPPPSKEEEEAAVELPTDRVGLARAVPHGFYQRVAAAFEIARIRISPGVYIIGTALATIFAAFVLYVISPPLVLLAVLVPVFARTWVAAKLRRIRTAFSDQLPDLLQLLASALRSGHSFINAMRVALDQSLDPIKAEFRRVIAGDQIGIPPEDSLREIARRMDNRDMEQVALLSELNRTAGGNTAEVIDTVVETVRERAEVRGMARTLTAQGRLSRWILTFLPLGILLFLTATEPSLMRPLFNTGIGQTALVITALMVVAGSFWMKKIIEIKV